MDDLHLGQISSLSLTDRSNNDLPFSHWEWAPGGLCSSPAHCVDLVDPPLVLKYVSHPSPDFYSMTREVSLLDLEPECKVLSFQRSPPPGSFLSPLSILPVHPNSSFHHSAFERSCMSKPLQFRPVEEEEALSPLDWTTGRTNLLASPFSDDSDSDDGLAPSPFSSPESSSKSETDEETREYLFSPPPSSERGHGYSDNHPSLELFHDHTDADASSSSSYLSAPISIPDAVPSSSYGSEECLQSPSLLSAPVPIFDSFYCFDHSSSAIPGSPRYRAVDLPAFEDEIDSKESRFGLGLHSTGPSYGFGDFHCGDEVPPPPGFLQRTTWLSLPGADTDDDLIPAELGSKTYIPDPSITIPTTPPARSLLIWDPTTHSGLPAGLPSFDGTNHSGHRFDVDAFPIRRPHSPEEDFDVDPAFLAKLAEKDAEKGVEVQKLCDLKQRTTIAACRGREGAQLDVERVREKWREVTALLRLKLASDEEAEKTVGVTHDARECASSGGAENGELPSSAPLVGAFSLSSSITSSPSSASTPEVLSDSSSIPSTSDGSNAGSSTSSPIRRGPSRPKITSMAQLVANMVFHRQQDALRRSPIRNRTWSPVSSTTHTTASGKTRSLTQTSPTSPLRQMILPEDLDNDSDGDGDAECGTSVLDSPLQLSPLCLSLCRSPESFYAQLEATTAVPLSTS